MLFILVCCQRNHCCWWMKLGSWDACLDPVAGSCSQHWASLSLECLLISRSAFRNQICPHILAPGGESCFLQHFCSLLKTATLGFRQKSWHYADWGGFSSSFRSKWAEVSRKPAPIQPKKVPGFMHFCRCSRNPKLQVSLSPFGVTELPCFLNVTPSMKPTVSLSVCPSAAMPGRARLLCAALHHSGEKWT